MGSLHAQGQAEGLRRPEEKPGDAIQAPLFFGPSPFGHDRVVIVDNAGIEHGSVFEQSIDHFFRQDIVGPVGSLGGGRIGGALYALEVDQCAFALGDQIRIDLK